MMLNRKYKIGIHCGLFLFYWSITAGGLSVMGAEINAPAGFIDNYKYLENNINLERDEGWSMAVDGAVDETKYNHDSSIVKHRGEWILGWNGNALTKEGVAGQQNYFARSNEWNKFRGQKHIAEMSSREWSINPVNAAGIQWHPSLMEFNGRLECWWFATSNGNFRVSLGYKSAWDDAKRKWRNYKIQLLANGRVSFSSAVDTIEEKDRIEINGTSYVPLPLSTAVRGSHGLLVMPMIISPAPLGGILGGSNEVVVFTSADNGDSWTWGSVIGKAPGEQRGSIWEPWMTWNGSSYRLFYRNFATVSAGGGYSFSQTKNLRKWPAAENAPLDMLPMRGETVTDGSNWYVALCERAQIGEGFESSQRWPLSLYRSRNGFDWLPVRPLLPAEINAFYCWPYSCGDGYLYFSTTATPGIVVGRIKFPKKESFYVSPERRFAASANTKPWSDGEKVIIAGTESLRLETNIAHGNGFSYAALVRTGPARQGISFDMARDPNNEWGGGILPTLDEGWRATFRGWADGSVTDVVTSRSYEIAFVGASFDEKNKVLRIVRRNLSDKWETKEWSARSVYLGSTPVDGTVTTLNGVNYIWKKNPRALTDILITQLQASCLENFRVVVLRNDHNIHAPLVSQMYSTAVNSVRSKVIFFTETQWKQIVVDGKYVRDDGNTFDVPKGYVTLNGNNRTKDAFNPKTALGAEIWSLGIWNQELSSDDFKALFNNLASIHRQPLERSGSNLDWPSAQVRLDPRNLSAEAIAVDTNGHNASWLNDQLTIFGDGAAAAEVPGEGNWTWSGEFKFDEFPVGMSWDLFVAGDKFNFGKLEIIRESRKDYFLKRGDLKIAAVAPDTWIKFAVNYNAGGAELKKPVEAIIRFGIQPQIHLGRWFYDIPDYLSINRPDNYKTQWRFINVVQTNR